MSGRFRFEGFLLDADDRQLLLDGAPLDLNSRYLDALALLVREQGKLVSKERFLEEVWRGVPVTDEALTQCIKTLRKQLRDDAGSPRFIETVPKHGYRFIAPVERVAGETTAAGASAPRREIFLLGGAGVLGGGAAGLIGGLIYGFIGAAQGGMGAISVLLVLAAVSALIGLIAGAGVGFGIALAGTRARDFWQWGIVGGAAGGLVVGALVKLIGLDAFTLFLGQSPGDITGASEGAILGGAVGFGGWLGHRFGGSLRRSLAIAAATGAAAGILIALIGGRLMAGSLHLLAQGFPSSRFNLDAIGALFGEAGFGFTSLAVTTAFEGALFSICVVGAIILARRRL